MLSMIWNDVEVVWKMVVAWCKGKGYGGVK